MDEPQLIRQSQEGDLQAFNSLVVAYQARVYNLAMRILGEPEAADDATQEAFISAFRNIRSYRGGSFRAWLMRIVTNACYDELRRWKRRRSTSLDAVSSDLEGGDADGYRALADEAEGPEEAAERSDLARAIEDCLSRLPADFRIVAVLSDIQGYEYREIAEIVGKPLGTIKSRLARARSRLQDCLQRYRELLPAAFRLEDEAIS